eukprot:s2113_g4.t1
MRGPGVPQRLLTKHSDYNGCKKRTSASANWMHASRVLSGPARRSISHSWIKDVPARHIHARRIVHRDLKSQNIFLSNAGGGGCIVKIGDFGIAKVLQHTRGLAQTLIGTPSNLPPEVCDSKPYGTKADIWSLGVVFYELLTLEPPFKAMSLAALAIKIVNGEPKPILNDFYAEEVRGLVRPMLEKDPARRPSAARLLQKNPLRRVAQMPSLPMLMERPSSSSISEVETLTPASVGRASLGVLEVQTPRSQEGEPSVPATPGSTILLEPLGSPRHFVATPVSEAAGSLSAQTDLLTELDVLSQAMLPCRTGDIPKEDPGQRRQTTAKCRKATSVQGRGNSNTAARYRRSLSSGAGFGISAVQGESTWARPPCARSSSRKKLKPPRSQSDVVRSGTVAVCKTECFVFVVPLSVTAYTNFEHVHIAATFLAAQANVDGKQFASSPLLAACESQNAEMAGFLIQAKADVNRQAWTMESPLLVAVSMNSARLVRLLLRNRASIHQEDRYQRAPMERVRAQGATSRSMPPTCKRERACLRERQQPAPPGRKKGQHQVGEAARQSGYGT